MRTQVRRHTADRNRAPASIPVGPFNVMMKRKKLNTSGAARSAGAGQRRKVTRSLETGAARTGRNSKAAGRAKIATGAKAASHAKPAPGAKAGPTQNAPATQYALGAECLISDALELKNQLSGLLDEPQSVTLDVSALQRIDTAGLQVIAAFVRERAARSFQTEWRGSAPALNSAVQLLGLASVLRLPERAGS